MLLALGFVYSVSTFKRHGGPSGGPGFWTNLNSASLSLSVLLFQAGPTASPKVWSSVRDKNILSALYSKLKGYVEKWFCYCSKFINIVNTFTGNSRQNILTAIHAAGTGRWNDPEMNKNNSIQLWAPTVPDTDTHSREDKDYDFAVPLMNDKGLQLLWNFASSCGLNH